MMIHKWLTTCATIVGYYITCHNKKCKLIYNDFITKYTIQFMAASDVDPPATTLSLNKKVVI